MRQNHILFQKCVERKIYQWCGTNGSPSSIGAPIRCIKPNEKWFTDVTYLLFGERTLYVSTIMDAFNREIISCVISESQTLTLAMKTLKQAMRGRKVKDVLLHSDQGSIYTAKEFQAYAKKRHDHQHVGEEIAMIMRHGKLLWSFKSEAFYSQKITKVSNTTVRKIVLEYIHYYNVCEFKKIKPPIPKEFREQVV